MNRLNRRLIIVFFLTIAMGCPTGLSRQAWARETPRGLFALSKNIQPMSDWIFSENSLAGVSLRAKWTDIEPQENQYHWTFDQDMAPAKKAGKKIILRISQGSNSPDWVYADGAEKFIFTESNSHRPGAGMTAVMPVPWDPVMLTKWTQLIKAFGDKYNKDEAVVLIQMVGPEKHGGEMHLPNTKMDKEHWRQIGYSKEKLVSAWITVIDAYADAFPDKPLALDVALPVYDDGAVEEVMAYAKQKLGDRFAVQHNALAAKTKTTGKPHKWVLTYRDKTIIGFQLLCSVIPQDRFNENGQRFGGTMAQGLQIGMDSGASYFEIYPADYKDPVSAAALRQTAQMLLRR